ncbi:putative ribonuclease H-like domain-containing protein [Tanacetum coccineum]
MSVELTNFEHTDLSINSESTKVDASPVNDDNANANEGNAEDDVYAHVLDDDDDVVVSDDEVNPNWRAYFPDHTVGDACGISPPQTARTGPSAKSYFDLASWYNNQDKVVMGHNVYTVGDRVKLGLQLKLRILWRKNKQRIKADHFTRYGSAEEARNHLPPKKVWGDRTEDEWNNLVDWWSHPDRVARSLQNAANRAKNTILTHQGKKSFAQGRNEYKVQKGHYEDLIETWRKTHSRPETGEFKTQKNLKRYLDMKSMQDQVRAGVIPYKTDQDILDEVVPSTNRQNMSGKGRKLPGGGSTSRRRGPQAFPDVISREEMDRILRQRDQEAELLRKQTAEAQQRAYLAALKADAAYQNSETMYGAIGEYFSNYAPNPTRPFMPPAFARPTMPQLSPEWAHLLNPPFPYNQPLQPSYAGPSQYTGPPGYTGPPRYTAPLQPLQPPYVGQFPFTPVNNNTFNNCYNPVMNSNLASTSNSRPELPRFIINPHNNDTRSVDELARDRELAGEDNDVGDNEEADSQQSSGDYSEDEEGDNEEEKLTQAELDEQSCLSLLESAKYCLEMAKESKEHLLERQKVLRDYEAGKLEDDSEKTCIKRAQTLLILYCNNLFKSSNQATMSRETTEDLETTLQDFQPQVKANDIKQNKTHITCGNCGMSRHTTDQCFELIGYPDWWNDGHKKGNKNRGLERGKASTANTGTDRKNSTGLGGMATTTVSEEDGSFSMSTTQNYNINQKQSGIFDCGATDTMTYDLSDFATSTKPTKSYIHMANGEKMNVRNGGTIEISPTLKLSNCHYVRALSHKLLSISHVTKELNCSVIMQPTFCILQDIRTGAIIRRGTERQGLYYVDELTASGTVMLAHVTSEREA